MLGRLHINFTSQLFPWSILPEHSPLNITDGVPGSDGTEITTKISLNSQPVVIKISRHNTQCTIVMYSLLNCSFEQGIKLHPALKLQLEISEILVRLEMPLIPHDPFDMCHVISGHVSPLCSSTLHSHKPIRVISGHVPVLCRNALHWHKFYDLKV